MPKFTCVILDCPYNLWQKPVVQELFSAIVALKLKGYRPVYNHGVMPVDSYDFIATHLLVCEEDENGKWKPVTGFKSVTNSRCKQFNLPFPATSILKAAPDTEAHSDALERIIDNCQNSGKEVSFDSSWTVDPDYQKCREASHLLLELFISNVTHWHTENAPKEVLGTGILRVRTNRFFERVGFKPVTAKGEQLPPFEQASLRGSPALLLHLQDWSPFARQVAEAHQNSWKNRVIIH